MGTIGRAAVLSVDGQEIQNIMSADINLSADLADDTTNDHDGWKANCVADSQAVLDVTCKYEETGGIQDVIDEYFTPTTDGMAVLFTPLVGGKVYTFNARISSLNVSTSTGETIDVSFTLESTGTVVDA